MYSNIGDIHIYIYQLNDTSKRNNLSKEIGLYLSRFSNKLWINKILDFFNNGILLIRVISVDV